MGTFKIEVERNLARAESKVEMRGKEQKRWRIASFII